MKTLLAILLSFIISEAPVLAIHGGYTLGGAQTVTGTYAGVLIPTSDTLLTTGSNAATGFGSDALGLFTLSIPTTGLGSGTVVLFSGQQQLFGSIQAIPDPNSTTGGIVGVITATGQITTSSFTDVFFGDTGSFTQVTGEASGGLTATATQSTNTISPTGVNINGTANMNVDTTVTGTDGTTSLVPTESIVFAVDGFQQSAVASASTSGT